MPQQQFTVAVPAAVAVPITPDGVPDLTQRFTYTVEDAAVLSGLSARTLQTALSAGELESVRVGKRRLIPRGSLFEYLGIDADGYPRERKLNE